MHALPQTGIRLGQNCNLRVAQRRESEFARFAQAEPNPRRPRLNTRDAFRDGVLGRFFARGLRAGDGGAQCDGPCREYKMAHVFRFDSTLAQDGGTRL